MPDLKKLYDVREQCYFVDEKHVLAPFENETYTVIVDEDQPELKITMTYADPPGNPAVQTQHRINDLTLQVFAPDGTAYWGNYGLMTGIWSVPNGSADTKNTVENVFIKDPQPGRWTITIHADELILDGHVETPEIDADYALVISGIKNFPDPPYGPTHGDVRCSHEFFYDIPINASNESCYVQWDWDDTICSEWFGPYSPGDTVSASHAYNQSGYYGIRTKVRDTQGNERSWSESWLFSADAPEVAIESVSSSIGKISTVVSNIGKGNASTIDYTISLAGGFILLGRETTGIITQLAPGESTTFASDFIFGFGPTLITITAIPKYNEGSEEWSHEAFIFFIYPYILPDTAVQHYP
jgi:hypothetical protein